MYSLWDQQVALGLCHLSLLWFVALEHVSGDAGPSASTIVAHPTWSSAWSSPETFRSLSPLWLGNQLFGTVALLAALILIRHELHLTTLWLPVVIVRSCWRFGAAWLIASLGVFPRHRSRHQLAADGLDVSNPILYPETIVPERYRFYVNLNPFTALIRNYRRILIEVPVPTGPGSDIFRSLRDLLLFGYWWFAKTRKNFADVIQIEVRV